MKQGVLRPGSDGGVTDTAYVADITGLLSTAATVARHARQVRVHLDGNAPNAGLSAAALARIRSLTIA